MKESNNSKFAKPISLAQHFDAPDHYAGHFGWVCGYSADKDFLNLATERFTRLTHAQRASQGRISLAVILDQGNPAISMQSAPGVLHCLTKASSVLPFRLLHAKVALLGFRNQEKPKEWVIRLVVSTGNWTTQTLEESLDLVWRVDVSSGDLSTPDAAANGADVRAAWEMMQSLRPLFDEQLLSAAAPGRVSESLQAAEMLESWIARCARGTPRFFDSRKQSLLAQLSDKIQSVDGTQYERNYLAMGSGFFEGRSDTGDQPEVPQKIVQALQDAGLLASKKVDVDIFVNPTACQAIAGSVKALHQQKFTIRSAATPSTVFGSSTNAVPRSLHAKFLFSAKQSVNTNRLARPWVYLGSGNLTRPGFVSKMSANGGNLEAGVVFASPTLHHRSSPEAQAHLVVTNLLPVQFDSEIEKDSSLTAGNEMEPRTERFLAPVIAYFQWSASPQSSDEGELSCAQDIPADLEVLDANGQACKKTEDGFTWPGMCPRTVVIRWNKFEREVPVLDEYGRIAATALRRLHMDEVIWQLLEFPLAPQAEEITDGEDEDGEGGGIAAKGTASTGSYPIRQMMELIEQIAIKQTAVPEADWNSWCNRLEQTLAQAKDNPSVEHFRNKLKLNPLSPLVQPAFRPVYAEQDDTTHGQIYTKVLASIATHWGVETLNSIGEKEQ